MSAKLPEQLDAALPFTGRVAGNVAAVVVNYKGWQDTIQCIKSIEQSAVAPAYVVVVDNGSPNDSWQHLTRHYEGYKTAPATCAGGAGDTLGQVCLQQADSAPALRLILIRSERNGGFGAGNNVGVRELWKRGFQGYLWILNSDAEVLPDCLSVLKDLSDRQRLPALIGTVLVDLDRPDRVQACGAAMSKPALLARHLCEGEPLERLQASSEITYADYPVGASFLLHSSLLQGQDLFDERYFLYFEEVALMQRLGIPRVPIATRAVVKHKGGATTGAFDRPQAWNALADYHSIRSRVLFGRQCGLVPAMGAVASGAAIALKRFLKVGPKAGINALNGLWSALHAAPAPGPVGRR
ncbi:hypothetical protein [Massilia phyllosphaerae]|uniref:hypothetical protein n=1 Tax=Massilia phyllosphaerae TaxID=3106034 RepID=UPI002B1CD34F|nr:hypothetical protein [Massilia sp. SGZ-792]